MNDTQESRKIAYPIRDLQKVWDGIDPIPTLQGRYEYGSRLFTKMVDFLQSAILDREAYEFYKNIGPARLEDETYEDYKVRQKFQRAIDKYKFTVKQAVFINTVEALQKKAKEDGKAKV